jgi:uridine kinase
MSYIIGITGGSGSGKTYFLQKLIAELDEKNVCTVSLDNYYKPRAMQPLDNNGVKNFDLPESIDSELFIADLLQLRSGKTVEKQEYTFNNPQLTPRLLRFEPKPIIIVEGIFALHFPEIRQLINLKVFIDAEDHVRIKRRIIRDNVERGYDLDDVLYRYENHVMPTYMQYIAPHKQTADLIVQNNKDFSIALDVIAVFLKNKAIAVS